MTSHATHTTAAPPVPTGVHPEFHNGARSRFNAWFFTAFDRYLNFILRVPKQRALGDLAPGRVLELGPGVGANFDFVPSGASLLAVEPNRAMHEALLARAAERDLDLELVAAAGEALPLADASVDDVICSLVLCTVDDPQRVLKEVLRVLRPGGTFRFVEHVAAHRASPRRWLQWAVSVPWDWVFEGCQLRRDTATLIEQAGFRHRAVAHHRLSRSVFIPVNTVISGVATK